MNKSRIRLSLGLLIFLLAGIFNNAFSQASVVAGSVTTSKINYTVGAGNNRLIVVAVTGEAGAIGTITGITWGAQTLTQARTQASGGIQRTDIWYLNESGISAARGSCTYNFVVTWSSAPVNEVFAAFTIKDADQATPIANVNSAQSPTAQTITTGNIAVGINDIVVYASSSNSDRTHTPPGTYTEQTDQIIGGAGGTSMATSTRAITAGTIENPTATWTAPDSQLISVGVGFNGIAATSVQTFYSRATGDWDSNTAWSFSADGSSGAVPAGVWPSRTDNVVIRSGHNITVNATDDNKICGLSPDGLALGNVGPFIASNIIMFYQTGDITIAGTLTVTGVEMMVSGYTHVLAAGAFNLSSYLVNVGYLEADAASTLSTLDDFVITGNSTTIINTNSTSADDFIIDHTNATLCGTGTATLQNGGGSTITYANSATVNQICTSFTINCTGGGCTGFPVVGTNPTIIGNTGPGGVGSNSGTSALKLWFRIDNGINVTGSDINSWTNSAGISGLDISEAGGQRPTLVANALNGFSEASFSGSNRLRTGLNLTTSNFVVDRASSFVVNRADNTGQTSSVYLTDPLEVNRFSNHIPWAGTVYYDIGNCCGNDARLDVGGLTGLTGYSVWSYDAAPATGKQLYRNGSLLLDRAGTNTYSSHATHRFNIGGNTGGTNGFQGDVTEVIIFNSKVNTTQRIIVDNYLAAKYGLPLSGNDVYTMDNPANGNFDFDVAGIGQASDGSNQLDAKGTGVVRIWNPNNLTNGEFLIWGRNSLNFSGGNTDVDNVIIQERLNRVWRVSEVGDVGTVSLSVDLNGVLGSAIGNNLRLLIDRDGDGFADNDVAPVAGSFSGTVVTFSGINLQNGDRFTIGNTNLALPLPIQLIVFEAIAQQAEVKLKWSTASEINNHFFTIQRSKDAESWQDVTAVKGSGTRNFRTDYETTDGLPFNGVSYYRLKQTDFDKQYSYSPVRRVELNTEFQLKVYPNPSSGTFTVSTGFEIGLDNIRLINSVGQTIPIQLQGDQRSTTLTSQSVAPGIYILQVSKGFWRQSVRVVIE
jgi:hypothetical protein